MKLFLSGGGSGNESEQIDAEFIKALDKTKPVLYIPIAIDTEKLASTPYTRHSCADSLG